MTMMMETKRDHEDEDGSNFMTFMIMTRYNDQKVFGFPIPVNVFESRFAD